MRAWCSRTFGLEAPVWRLVVLLIVVCLIFGVTLALVASGKDRPTPDEFCAGHGGVRYLSVGGWARPDAATCRDGHAGNVYP